MKKYMLFYTPVCPKCPKVKDYMGAQEGFEKEWVDASKPEGLVKARDNNVSSVPTVIFFEDGKEYARATSLDEVKRVIENKTLV